MRSHQIDTRRRDTLSGSRGQVDDPLPGGTLLQLCRKLYDYKKPTRILSGFGNRRMYRLLGNTRI